MSAEKVTTNPVKNVAASLAAWWEQIRTPNPADLPPLLAEAVRAGSSDKLLQAADLLTRSCSQAGVIGTSQYFTLAKPLLEAVVHERHLEAESVVTKQLLADASTNGFCLAVQTLDSESGRGILADHAKRYQNGSFQYSIAALADQCARMSDPELQRKVLENVAPLDGSSAVRIALAFPNGFLSPANHQLAAKILAEHPAELLSLAYSYDFPKGSNPWLACEALGNLLERRDGSYAGDALKFLMDRSSDKTFGGLAYAQLSGHAAAVSRLVASDSDQDRVSQAARIIGAFRLLADAPDPSARVRFEDTLAREFKPSLVDSFLYLEAYVRVLQDNESPVWRKRQCIEQVATLGPVAYCASEGLVAALQEPKFNAEDRRLIYGALNKIGGATAQAAFLAAVSVPPGQDTWMAVELLRKDVSNAFSEQLADKLLMLAAASKPAVHESIAEVLEKHSQTSATARAHAALLSDHSDSLAGLLALAPDYRNLVEERRCEAAARSAKQGWRSRDMDEFTNALINLQRGDWTYQDCGKVLGQHFSSIGARTANLLIAEALKENRPLIDLKEPWASPLVWLLRTAPASEFVRFLDDLDPARRDKIRELTRAPETRAFFGFAHLEKLLPELSDCGPWPLTEFRQSHSTERKISLRVVDRSSEPEGPLVERMDEIVGQSIRGEDRVPKDEIARLIDDPRSRLLVAEENGRIVGFCLYQAWSRDSSNQADFGFLPYMAIDIAYQRKFGLGSAMLSKALQDAHAIGSLGYELNASEETSADEFYRHFCDKWNEAGAQFGTLHFHRGNHGLGLHSSPDALFFDQDGTVARRFLPAWTIRG